MSSSVADQPVRVDKEQRKKDKAKRKKAAKQELVNQSKRRRVEEVEEPQDDGITKGLESPSKRARTGESRVLVPDSQQPSLPVDSPFHNVVASIRVSIPPISQSWPLEGVCANFLSPLLLTYNPQLKGVIMAYNHPRLASAPLSPSELPQGDESKDIPSTLAQAVDEYAAPFVWVTAHFLILRPEKGSWLEGHVSLQNESHISLILWNMFSVSIEKKCLPKAWRWVDNGANGDSAAGTEEEDIPMLRPNEVWGTWVDGSKLPVEGMLRFRVVDFDVAIPSAGTETGFMSVEGSLLTEQEEKELEKERHASMNPPSIPHRPGKKKKISSTSAAGTQVNGVASSSKSRH
jgi:DNA-directed RNA polymerase I subunit RPA43